MKLSVKNPINTKKYTIQGENCSLFKKERFRRIGVRGKGSLQIVFYRIQTLKNWRPSVTGGLAGARNRPGPQILLVTVQPTTKKNIQVRIPYRREIEDLIVKHSSGLDVPTFKQYCGSGSGAFLTPGSGIKDPGWVKSQDSDPGWTTRIIFPRNHFFG